MIGIDAAEDKEKPTGSGDETKVIDRVQVRDRVQARAISMPMAAAHLTTQMGGQSSRLPKGVDIVLPFLTVVEVHHLVSVVKMGS
jgi:hypothetical protein